MANEVQNKTLDPAIVKALESASNQGWQVLPPERRVAPGFYQTLTVALFSAIAYLAIQLALVTQDRNIARNASRGWEQAYSRMVVRNIWPAQTNVVLTSSLNP